MASKDIKDEALALTKKILVFDVYTPAPHFRYWEKKGYFQRNGKSYLGIEAQVTLPKLIKGGIDAVGLSLSRGGHSIHDTFGGVKPDFDNPKWYEFSWPGDPYLPYKYEDYPRSSLAGTLILYEIWMREVEATNGKMIIAKKTDDIISAKENGKIANVLHLNNISIIEDSLDILRLLYRLGFRMIILAHSGRNLVADGFTETRTKSKLTTFGISVVQEMNKLGIIIDVSHLSESCFYDVLDVSKDPVIASHSNSRKLCNHPRNLTDDQLKALAEKGGKVGLTFVPKFIDAGWKMNKTIKAGFDVKSPIFQKFLDHVDHIVNLIGIKNVMIGSDFDGGGILLKDSSEFSKVTEGLISRGYSKQEIKRILGENALDIMRKVVG